MLDDMLILSELPKAFVNKPSMLVSGGVSKVGETDMLLELESSRVS